MSAEDSFAQPQFALPQAAKEARLHHGLAEAIRHHCAGCPPYAALVHALYPHWQASARLTDLPMVPASLFKSMTLTTQTGHPVVTTLTSSGTSGRAVSRISVDAETADRQAKAMSAALQPVLGRQRLPMLILDSQTVLGGGGINARAAGILGLMRFGRDHVFALNAAMECDSAAIDGFLSRHGRAPFLMFGFTFMVWAHFFAAIRDQGLDLSQGILVHGGGWKAMTDRSVDNAVFRAAFQAATGLRRIHDFYGMAEQMGTLFVEGDDGLLYAPDFADVIIRDPVTLAPLPVGETGVIQVLSLVPRSYPGNSVLTEDLGRVVHVDQPVSAGRLGKAFRVLGRVPQAEIRGCGDTFAQGIRA
ncbi:MAG: hypothetical protein FD176_2892 [Rhodospirillaceae bacterium]|nr:MAG: hypothetical protein FD176_2892 [Rhodospirillaceae bacterium]TNC95333.1 MAG: hypothetical protein FD119_2457 [Stygiobacter sp.]